MPFPSAEIKNKLKEQIYTIWQKEWDAYKEGRQSKFFLKEPDIARSKEAMKLSRSEQGKLIRILTGHNALLYHRHNVEPETNDPFCRFCSEHEYETIIHIVTSCPRFAGNRRLYLQTDSLQNEEWSISKLLDFASVADISSALDGYYDGIHYSDKYT